MLEEAIAFSVAARVFSNGRHDIFIPGQRNAVARIEPLKHDEHGQKTKTLKISTGPEFEYTIGYLRSDEALDSTQRHIGQVAIPKESTKNSVPGEFRQFELDTLIRTEEKCGRIVRYRSSTSPGFSVAKPRRNSRCEFIIHDERVNRTLVMAAYIHEQRLPIPIAIPLYLFAGIFKLIDLALRSI